MLTKGTLQALRYRVPHGKLRAALRTHSGEVTIYVCVFIFSLTPRALFKGRVCIGSASKDRRDKAEAGCPCVE